ncbi:MAG: hypothetical protein HQ523_01835 [Lentisphaerae bacterium]|nr:hypothetical protein [Lentisphaerota bacterium]
MADEEQVVEEPLATIEAAAGESGPADTATAEPPKLRVKPTDPGDADDEIGVFPPDTVPADDEIGPPPSAGKFKLAGLFGGAKTADEDDSPDDGAKWAGTASPDRPRRQGSGIRLVNRFLVAAIVLILFLGVLDLFATGRWDKGDRGPLSPLDGGGDLALLPHSANSASGLPPLAKLLDSFKKRPIVRDLDRGPGGTVATSVKSPPVGPDWRSYGQHLNLIGLSPLSSGEQEAIVFDSKTKRTYFLQIEQELVAGEDQLKLIRIAADHVVFEKDGEELRVE